MTQTWLLFIFVLTLGILVKNREYLKNKYVLFSFLWFMYEILFYIFYPSNEMRYLFSSLAAAIAFLSSLVSNIFLNIDQNKFSKIAKYGFTIILLSILTMNTVWSYNFRGYLASIFIVVDKEINYINRFYRNSLCIYSDDTLLYYTRHTTNQYVNSNAKYISKYGDIISVGPQGAHVLNPEKYDYVISLNSTGTDKAPTKIFNSVIEDSLYDSLQSHVGFKIHAVSTFSTAIGEVSDHPQVDLIAIYRVK